MKETELYTVNDFTTLAELKKLGKMVLSSKKKIYRKDVYHLIKLMISTFKVTQNGLDKIEDSLRILAKENERLKERIEKAVNLGFEI